MSNPSSRLPSARAPRPTSMFEVSSEHLKKLQNIGKGTEKSTIDQMYPAEATTTTSKTSKRRSLLPSFSSRKGVDEERGMPASIPEDSPSTSSTSSRAMLPPPKPSRLGSLRAPGRALAPHTRTTSRDSAAISSAPKSDTTDQAATPQRTMALKADAIPKRSSSTRLPQSPGIRPPSSGLNQPSRLAHARTSSTASATSSTTAQKRSSMIAPRTTGVTTTSPPRGMSPTKTSPPRSSLARPTSSRQQMPPPSRPTFSTYQQHYSPAKSVLPKPPIPGIKSKIAGAPSLTGSAARPSSADSDIPVTFDTALAQIELLQLSLLHQTSAAQFEEYQASAKQKVGQRHAQLQKDFASVRAQEQERRRTTNLTALESWCAEPDLLAEHIQTLSRVVTELRSQTESGSRYFELTETFEKWATGAEAILLDDKNPANFIEALPESWRATHTSLALKFRSIQRDLSVLPPVPPLSSSGGVGSTSSLEVLLGNSAALVDGILKELEVMTKLQKEVLQRGKERIDEQISALVNANDETSEKENWVPAWQSVA